MGVRGLTSLMKDKHEDSWEIRSVDRVVVDAQAFAMELYFSKCGDGDWILSGDYLGFISVLTAFLESLVEDGIDAYFVFDGSTPVEKIDTKRDREINKCLFVQTKLQSNLKFAERAPSKEERGPPPALLHAFTKYVLQKLGVRYVMADSEADTPVVAECVDRKAFVVSNDSDHMIMEGPLGFVDMKDFVMRESGQLKFRTITNAIVAELLRVPVAKLPALASLVGNDYVHVDKLEEFHARVLGNFQGPNERRDWRVIHAIARWLQRYSRDIRDIPKSTEELQISEELWAYSIDSYTVLGARDEVKPDALANPAAHIPQWLVHLLRVSPSCPRQLMGMIINNTHLNPPLVEALRPGEQSSWAQSLPIRTIVAQAFSLQSFNEWTHCAVPEAEEIVKIDYTSRFVRVVPRAVSAFSVDSLPIRADARPAVDESETKFFAALGWHDVPMEELKKTLSRGGVFVQLAALFFWTHSFQKQWDRLPAWIDLAALLLLLFVSPEKRGERKAKTPLKQEQTQAFASFEGCLISALELHTVLGAPFEINFEHLFDGNFLHALADRSSVRTSDFLDESEGAGFDRTITLLLIALSKAMKPQLKGEASRSEGSWKFSKKAKSIESRAPTAQRTADSGVDVAKEIKKLEKKLRQIGDLEARGDLNEEEWEKVRKRPGLEIELQALKDTSGDVPQQSVFDQWSVRQA